MSTQTGTLKAGYQLVIEGFGAEGVDYDVSLQGADVSISKKQIANSQAYGPYEYDANYTVTVISGSPVIYKVQPNGQREYTADTLPASLPAGQSVVVDRLLVTGRGDGLTGMQNRILAFPFNSDGIDAAVSAIVATGKPGVVEYAAVRYSVTRNHTLVSGVSHVGVPLEMVFGASDNVPDFWKINQNSRGTIFDLSDGVIGFIHNNSPSASVQSPLMAYTIKQVHLYGIALNGGLAGIRIGAVNNAGIVDGSIDEIYAYNQSCSDGGFAIDIHNSQFFHTGRIRVSNDQAGANGGNYRVAASIPGSVLLPGDSHINEIFSRCTSRTRRGVVVEAGLGATAAILNDIKITGRIHASRYTASTPATVNLTSISGNPDISVPADSEFALCTIGMPVRWQTTAPSGFDAVVTYFVVARNATNNTVRLSDSDYSSAITPTSSGAFATYIAGYPTFIARADAGCAVKNSNFGDMACEVTGNIGAVMFSKTRNCNVNLSNPSTSYTGTGVIVRDAEIGITYSGANNIGVDESLSFGPAKFTNLAGGTYQYSGASFTLDSSWNNRTIRYSGTSDITITIPRKMPSGFNFEVVTTGATGIVTIAAASGLGLWSKSGLRTNGQYARAKIQQISTLGYHVSGDLQV